MVMIRRLRSLMSKVMSVINLLNFILDSKTLFNHSKHMSKKLDQTNVELELSSARKDLAPDNNEVNKEIVVKYISEYPGANPEAVETKYPEAVETKYPEQLDQIQLPVRKDRKEATLHSIKNSSSKGSVKFNNEDLVNLKKVDNYITKKKLKKVKCKLFCCSWGNITQDNLAKSFMIGEKMLEYDFNIITIQKKLIEYEKIKHVLFNEDQLEGIKLIKTPRKIDYRREIEEKVSQVEDDLKFRDEWDEEYLRNLNTHLTSLRVFVKTNEYNRKIMNEIDFLV